jgi:hypothetical protein
MLASQLVAKVVTEGGFDTAASDTTSDTVLSWINEMYREMVSSAEWLRSERQLGVTVVGQDLYDLADDVIRISKVAVNGDSSWKIVTAEELLDLKWQGDVALWSAPGVVAQVYDEVTGRQKLQLWPAPQSAGYAIQALASILPAPLTTTPTDTPPLLPVDVHEAIADGAIGLGRLRIDERDDLAEPYLQKFQAAVGKLVKRRRSRIQDGAWQAGVGGRR